VFSCTRSRVCRSVLRSPRSRCVCRRCRMLRCARSRCVCRRRSMLGSPRSRSVCRRRSVLRSARSRVCRRSCCVCRCCSVLRSTWSRCVRRRSRVLGRTRRGMSSRTRFRRCPCRSACFHPSGRSMVFRCQRLCGNQRLWMPAIRLGVRSLVSPRRRYMLGLVTGGSNMRLVRRGLLFGRGLVLNPSGAAVESHVAVPGHKAAVHGRAVFIDMAAPCSARAHMHHYSVVGENSALPNAAGKANAAIAETVVHASIKAHRRTPVAFIEDKKPVVPAPITRRPQRANVGRGHPCARHPEIVAVSIAPISRCPHQAWIGADGLLVNRQHRGSKIDADQNTSA
jgi:hypothetical protein